MTIQLDKILADAICTAVTVGFLQKEIRKTGEYKTQFIYEDGKDKADHDKIKGYLKNLGINVDFCLQEDKVTHPLVLAMTKSITSETEKNIQDSEAYKALLVDMNSYIKKQVPFYGAYIGGCVKPDNSIDFSGSSGLKLYDRPTDWNINLENSIVEKSFNNAKVTTDNINKYLKEYISTHNNKKPKYLYRQDISSTTPAKFEDNKLFGSIHGLVRVIIEYNLMPSGIGSGKDEICCELALSSDTQKVGSCIPCSIFASSNNTPANYTHLGRGDNWNFPDVTMSSAANLKDKKNNWNKYVKECFDEGLEKIKGYKAPAIVKLQEVADLKNEEKIGEIFLHSLTFEGKFTEKMKKTFEVLGV